MLSDPWPAPGNPPALGADTRAWLRQLNRSDADIDRLLADGVIGIAS